MSGRGAHPAAVPVAVCGAAVGAVALLGWATGVEALIRISPSWVAMQPTTAIDFLLLGTAVAALGARGAAPGVARGVATVAACVVLVVSGAALVAEVLQRPYPFPSLAYMAQNQGRMSGIAAVAHLLLVGGIVALVLHRRALAHGFAIAALVIGLTAMSGYAYGPADLYDVGYFQTIALHTAVGITLIACALLLAIGRVGLSHLAQSHTQGGVLVRRLLPVVVIVPAVLGWGAIWLMRERVAGPGFALALYSSLCSTVSGGVVWWSGTRLRSGDISRQTAEAARAEADRALAELSLVTDELRLANRDVRDFTAAAAHDLRGPLSAISMGVQMLRRSPGEPTASQVIERLGSSAARGMTLIDDLLDYQQVGTVSVSGGRLDLAALVDAAVEGTEQASGRQVRLHAGPWDEVVGDERLVARLVSNLVGNAVKYTPGSGPVDLLVEARREGERVRVRVADRGLPLPEEEREMVFEIFRRGLAGSGVEGTGIGLAICRRIVERQGGTIAVTDLDGWSKSFDVVLPAYVG